MKAVFLNQLYNDNVDQNSHFFSVDLVYNWQFAQGSFFTLVWKDFAGINSNLFEKNYAKKFRYDRTR